jgi:hypothetical protein
MAMTAVLLIGMLVLIVANAFFGERVTATEFSLTAEAVRENRIDFVRISRDRSPLDDPTA